MPLKLGHYTYEAQLTLADVQRPLLGADFLRSHDLLVDLRGKRLVQADTLAPTTCSTTTGQQLHLATVENDGNKYRDVTHEFPDLLKPTFSSAEVKDNTEHFIKPTGAPVYGKARRLPPDKLQAAKKEFEEMEAMGIIRKSSNPWSSPLHIVPKSNGG